MTGSKWERWERWEMTASLWYLAGESWSDDITLSNTHTHTHTTQIHNGEKA